MNNRKVILITGAGRGMGVDIAKAALAAGHCVVATGRKPEKVSAALGENQDLLVLKLDITSGQDADEAVKAAIERFGKIDVLINNGAIFNGGFFEEQSMEEIEMQLATGLFGPMKVTRAVLPLMRKERSGHIITISSTAGLLGFTFCSAYAASKFAVEGWMQSLQTEIEPFGITTTLVNPGFFRTELLTEDSVNYASNSIEDYDEERKKQMESWKNANGKQPGNPVKLANALLTIIDQEKPPLRFIAGEDAVAIAEQVSASLKKETNAYRELSSNLSFNEA